MRAFRALLRLYPSAFRGEFGAELEADFARRRRTSGTLALWLESVADVLANAPRVHLDLLLQDVRFMRSSLGRARGFAATAVLLSALGVGATTAAFSIADHVLLRPLPYRDPARLVKVWQSQPAAGYPRMEMSPGTWRDFQQRSSSFERLAATYSLAVNLRGEGEPERVDAAWVSADLFPTLGVPPLLGRTFLPADDVHGAPGTVVLSQALWTRRFAADPGVLGRQVVIDDEPFTVIGVMPDGFAYPSRAAQLWKPFRFAPELYEDRGNTFLMGIGRLREGVTREQAAQELRVLAAQLQREHPDLAGYGSAVLSIREELSDQSRLLVVGVLFAAGCLLLIACSNLAGLLSARAVERRQELAVRTALGAGRDRLVRQLLTESLLLASAGGVLGLGVAVAAAPLLARLVPNVLPVAEVPGVDWRVLGFAALVTAATGVGFGVVPALRSVVQVDVGALRERAGTGGRGRLRAVLLASEVAVSVVLLVSSGLLLRALLRVQATDPGFDPRGVITLRTTLPFPRYAPVAVRKEFYRAVLEGARALPGVTQAAYTTGLPMVHRGGMWPVNATDTTAGGPPATASMRFVTPGYFAAMGIPLRRGRDLAESDGPDALQVAVVSASFAERHWPGVDPIGRRFQFGKGPDGSSPFGERTVVGVVGDVRFRGLERTSEPQFYLAYQQVWDGALIGFTPQDLVVKASGDPGPVMAALRGVVRRADPQQPVAALRALGDVLAVETAPRAVQVRVLAGFAGVAVLLAAVGMYGLLAFTVAARARELGVRRALGARPRDIVALVVRHAAALAVAGVAAGLPLALAAGRALSGLLAGVSPHDLATCASAAGVVLLATLLGCLVPALRALRVSPMVALRAG